MPDKYESLYAAQYGTTSVSGDFTVSAWTPYTQYTTDQEPIPGQLFPHDLIVTSSMQDVVIALIHDPQWLWISVEFSTTNVEIFWDVPAMVGATHAAGFRRSGTDMTAFTPSPELEHFRVPINTTYYLDQNVPVGNYVYQVFPLVES